MSWLMHSKYSIRSVEAELTMHGKWPKPLPRESTWQAAYNPETEHQKSFNRRIYTNIGE